MQYYPGYTQGNKLIFSYVRIFDASTIAIYLLHVRILFVTGFGKDLILTPTLKRCTLYNMYACG